MTYLVDVLYIFAFALFIYGLMGLTGPKTAVRGNWIAATGMAIAVIATLIRIRDTASINWILIVAGLAIGVILGVPPAKKTKMTAMPQLVALFNGVGGGTVALIAWAARLAWVSTAPLSGMAGSRTKSKAEIRSEATSRSWSSRARPSSPIGA